MFNLDNPKEWAILVADDEPDNVDVVAETLEYFGATVRTVTNGEEALEALKSFVPNLVLLDLSMPKMDGWETRRNIKANPATAAIPVVALSAHAMHGDKARALEVGFDGYLTKPVSISTLLDDIRTALAEAKSQTASPAPEATSPVPEAVNAEPEKPGTVNPVSERTEA